MAKKTSNDSKWTGLESRFDSSMDSSIDSGIEGSSVIEMDDETRRHNLKGLPIIGKWKRSWQYTVTLVGAIVMFATSGYLGYTAYKQNEVVKDMKVANSNISNLIDLSEKSIVDYAYMSNESLSKLNNAKRDIEKNIGILRSNESVNNGAISSIDNYWKLLLQKINVIEGSKEKISQNKILIDTTLLNLNKNEIILAELIKSTTTRADVGAYKVLYMSQILSDIQSLSKSVTELKAPNSNYDTIIKQINVYNPIIDKKIDALIDAGLPPDVKKVVLSVKEDMIMSSNNINSVIQSLQPLIVNLDKIKKPNGTIELSVGQLKSSITNFESKNVYYNALFALLSLVLSIFGSILVVMVNAKELSKDLIISEEKRTNLENLALRMAHDVGLIANGDYTVRVRNMTETLMPLRESINKLVENYTDKITSIYNITNDLRNDNARYEKLCNDLIEKNNTQNNYKNELKENKKKHENLNLNVKSRNIEVSNKLLALLPEFSNATTNLDLYIQTVKEIDSKKDTIKNKSVKLEENFNNIKKGLSKLINCCEFMETLSLNSEMISQRSHENNVSKSFNRIAEDFNNKAEEIKNECNSMVIYLDDTKNELFSINKNSEDIERYTKDTDSYFNSIKKIFPEIYNLLLILKNNQSTYKQEGAQLAEIIEADEDLILEMEELIRQVENYLTEVKELNKLNKIRTADMQSSVRFIEQLKK